MPSFRVSLQDTDPAQLAVLGFYNTPPAHLAGRRVVVGTSPTGAFNGHANKIAWSDGTNWWFDQPAAGWETWSDADAGHYYFTGSAWVSRAAFVNGLSYWTKTGNDIYYNSGNVGIGTANPGASLNIRNTVNQSGQIIDTSGVISTVGGDTTYGLLINHGRLGSDNSSISYGLYSNNTAASSGNNHSMYSVYGYSQTPMRYSGNTVVGVKGEVEHKWVGGTAVTGGILIGVDSNLKFFDDSVAFTVPHGYGYRATVNVPANKILTNYYGIYLSDKTGSGTIGTQWGIYQLGSSIKNYFAGNVGIGTSNPGSYKLNVSGSLLTSDTAYLYPSANGVTAAQIGRFAFGSVTGGYGQFGEGLIFSGANYVYRYNDYATKINMSSGFGFDTAPIGTAGNNATFTRRMTITNSGDVQIPTGVLTVSGSGNSSFTGNVGIGTTSPGALLDVQGNIRVGSGNQLEFGSAANHILGTVTGNYLKFNTNSAERVRIDSSGNVGIGTTNPLHKLSVTGQGYFSTGVTFPVGGSVDWASGNARITQSSYNLIFSTWTGSALTEKLRITGAGNVGIGTTNPAYKLDVWGPGIDGSETEFRIVNPNTGASASSRLTLASWASGETAIERAAIEGLRDSGGNNGLLAFHTRTSGSGLTEKMRINQSGNVGIGTTSPLQKLHIAGDMVYSQSLSGQLYVGGATDTNKRLMLGYDTTNNFGFIEGINYGTAYSNVVINPYAGNVGIGTTAPVNKLSVNGSMNIADGNGYSFGAGIQNGNAVIYGNAAAGTITLQTNNSPAQSVYLKGGNLGIGTTNPGAKLDVAWGGYQTIPGIRIGADIGNLSTRTNATRKLGSIGVPHYTNSEENILFSHIDSQASASEMRIGGGDANWNAVTGIHFYTAANNVTTIGTERLTITSAGNVGIGTTSPSVRMDVFGRGAFGTMGSNRASYGNTLSLVNASSTDTSLFLWQSGVASGHIGFTSGSNLLRIVNSSSDGSLTNSASIVLTNTGNVGVGTTNPLQKLHVSAGDINLDTGYGIRVNNTAAAGQFLRGNGTRFVASAIQAGDLPVHYHINAAGWNFDAINDLIYTDSIGDRRVAIGTASPVRDTALQIYNSQASLAEVLISTADNSFVEFNNLAISQHDLITGFRGLVAHTFDFGNEAFTFPNAILAGFTGDISHGMDYSFAELFPNEGAILPGLRIKFHPDGNDSFYRHASLFRETQYNAAFEITNFYPGEMPAMKLFHGDTGPYLQFTHNGSGSAIEANEAIQVIGVGGVSFYTGGIITYVKNAGLGIDVADPAALLHIGAGINTKAPLKFTSGTNLTTPQSGAMEWDGTRLYITNSARQTLAYLKDFGLKSSQTAVINATAHLTQTVIHGDSVGSSTILANTFAAGDVLTRKLTGVYRTGTTPQDITIRVLLNSTQILSVTGWVQATDSADWNWTGEVSLTIKTTGSSGKGLLTGAFFMESRVSGYPIMIPLTLTSEVDIDTTQSNTLVINARWANSGNSLKTIHSNIKLERVN